MIARIRVFLAKLLLWPSLVFVMTAMKIGGRHLLEDYGMEFDEMQEKVTYQQCPHCGGDLPGMWEEEDV